MAEPDLTRLAEPFPAEALEWRVQQAAAGRSGRIYAIVLPYLTSRAVQARLDEVCGPAGWKNHFREGPAGGVLCGISIRVAGAWITKWDGGENTNLESVKGGLSTAFRRAGVHWGIGRYCYALSTMYADIREDGIYRGKTPDGQPFRWNPPVLPAWAIPEASHTPAPALDRTAA